MEIKNYKENLNKLVTSFLEFLEEYKKEKSELSRNQGALWTDVKAQKDEIRKINSMVQMHERILSGEGAYKGLIYTEEENKKMILNSIEENKKIKEELNRKIDNVLSRLDTKEQLQENTLKNITLLCKILSSGMFLSIIGFLFKLFINK